MNQYIQIALIICGIYVVYVGLFMVMFKGRQKNQILKAIPEEAKAKAYGKVCGSMVLIAGILAIGCAVLWMMTGQEIYSTILEFVLLVVVVLNLYLNKKYSGGYTITIY